MFQIILVFNREVYYPNESILLQMSCRVKNAGLWRKETVEAYLAQTK